jgi:hypothetical protein
MASSSSGEGDKREGRRGNMIYRSQGPYPWPEIGPFTKVRKRESEVTGTARIIPT